MKYIDAEKLIAEIERRLKIVEPHKHTFESAVACRQELIWMKEFITSLQQEQPECSSSLVDVDAVREDFIREVYRVLDADPTNDRANAIIGAFDSLPTIQQPEVDLEKEIRNYNVPFNGWERLTYNTLEAIASHFYELGKNARKEE